MAKSKEVFTVVWLEPAKYGDDATIKTFTGDFDAVQKQLDAVAAQAPMLIGGAPIDFHIETKTVLTLEDVPKKVRKPRAAKAAQVLSDAGTFIVEATTVKLNKDGSPRKKPGRKNKPEENGTSNGTTVSVIE